MTEQLCKRQCEVRLRTVLVCKKLNSTTSGEALEYKQEPAIVSAEWLTHMRQGLAKGSKENSPLVVYII